MEKRKLFITYRSHFSRRFKTLGKSIYPGGWDAPLVKMLECPDGFDRSLCSRPSRKPSKLVTISRQVVANCYIPVVLENRWEIVSRQTGICLVSVTRPLGKPFLAIFPFSKLFFPSRNPCFVVFILSFMLA